MNQSQLDSKHCLVSRHDVKSRECWSLRHSNGNNYSQLKNSASSWLTSLEIESRKNN